MAAATTLERPIRQKTQFLNPFRTFRCKDLSLEEKQGCYLVTAFWAMCTVALISLFFPRAAHFGFFELWKVKQGTWTDWLKVGIPIFVWGGGVTLIMSLLTLNKRKENQEAETLFGLSTLLSLWAGVVEEICFRWLIFLNAVIFAKVANFFLLGWCTTGLIKWLHLHFFGWLTNLATFGQMEQFIYFPAEWAVGAAILSANALFRDGHKYQGPFGLVNSWYIGMFLFWVMFNYGLLAAILIHFVYDFIIDIVRYLDRVTERCLGLHA